MHWRLVGIIALMIGVTLRLCSIHWNAVVIHGDVNIDVSAAASLSTYGKLLAFGDLHPEQAIPPESDGQPMAQHGPVWAGLGAVFLRSMPAHSVGDIHRTLSFLSFVGGLMVLALMFFLTKKLVSRDGAWIVVGWLSLSWLMIDYSGNGSMYSFQTVLYLLWVLIALSPELRGRALLLGLVSGAAYLLNFQAIILMPASVIVLLLERPRIYPEPSRGTGASSFAQPWKAALMIGASLLIIFPWLLRNHVVFGDPFYHHAINSIYVIQKGGFAHLMDEHLRIPLGNWIEIFWGSITVWLPNNLYYAARKLMILAPIAFFFAAYGLIDVVFSRERFRKLFPILLLCALHLLLSAAWPVMKFRYLVPLLPFVFFLSLEQMEHIKVPARLKQGIIGVTFLSITAFSFLTYRAIPTHTYYYDGAITQDAFHGNEELQYLRDHQVIP